MFRPLRKEFMVVNSLLILTVLYGALIAFYFVTWWHGEQAITLTMARHMSAPAYDKRDAENPNLFVSTIGAATYEYISDIPDSNIFKYFDTMYISDSFSTSQTNSILKRIVADNNDSGVVLLDNRYFKYVQQAINRDTIKIVVLEVTRSILGLRSTRNILLIIAVCSLPFAIAGSKFITDRSIKPLEAMVARQKAFFSDISHELRTPLTVALTNLAVIESHKEETVSSQERWLGFLKDQLERLANLVNEMLYLESMSLPRSTGFEETIDLSTLVDRYIKSVGAVVSQKQLNLQADIQDGIDFYGEKEALTRLVSVLIDNAIKYTPEGGTITATLSQPNRKIVFTVKNTGEGIEPQHIDRIFDRLYRVSKSRSTSEGGKGLGLAIAKSVVERYGGTIGVESQVGKYTVFTVTLPKPNRKA